MQSISHTEGKEAILGRKRPVRVLTFMMCNVHAGLPELVGELFPDEEVEQLPGLDHHHLAACHVVQGLNEFLQMLNNNEFIEYANVFGYSYGTLKQEVFTKIDKGIDVIDLGVGDPDIPTPKRIIDALHSSSLNPENHRYPSYAGMMSFRDEVATWYKRRFNVEIKGNKNVIALIGSKEGVAHAPLAFINPGDIALVPDPGYPVYSVATEFAGGTPYVMPLLESNGFMPDLEIIPEDFLKKTKIMVLN